MSEVRIPQALADALRPAAEKLGFQLPTLVVGQVCIDDPIRDVAMQMGQHLSDCGLYRVGGNRTLKARTIEGNWEKMTPDWFCGWVQEFLTVTKSYAGKKGQTMYVETTMGSQVAAKILAQDVFLTEIPVIEQFAPVRCPVRRSDGRYELTKKGYDAESKVFCEDRVSYSLEMSPAEALEFWGKTFGEFPWADMDEKLGLWGNRSFLVHLSACLGMYMRLCFPTETVRPLLAFVANEQGSGKTIIASSVTAPIFGIASVADLPLNNGKVDAPKFTVLLETVAQTMQPYLFLDDVPNSIFSNSLNSFITRPRHTGRKFGKNDEMFDVPNVTQVMITGNNVHVKRDIMQRALVCELFCSVSSESRTPSFEMTTSWLACEENRAKMLSALHCFFREWVKAGSPKGHTVKRRAVEWSSVIGGVIETAGVSRDPFETPELPMSGDTETDEFQMLLCAIADDAEEELEMCEEAGRPWDGYSVDTKEVIEKARSLGLLVGLVGLPGEKDLKKGELISLGRKMEPFRGKEDMRTKKGRAFRFGSRRQKSGTVYPVEWL